MIVILKNGAAEEKKNQLIDWLKEQGLQIHTSVGEYQTVLGLVGDTSRVDMDLIASLGIVDSVKRVTEPFKCCNRKFHPDDTVVRGRRTCSIGGGNFVMIAGPCSRRERGADRRHRNGGQGIRRADPPRRRVQAAHLALRLPGPCAPRGSSFLKIARKETGLPIVTEIMGISAHRPVSRMWTSSRSARAICRTLSCSRSSASSDKPILLKRGLATTHQGAADERRVHHGGRQRAGHPLRARHPHV